MIIPVGGFLGAGKTSLILAAARLLTSRGIKTAAILNDQGDDLVDVSWMRAQGIQTDQVAGGCFCCLFSELIAAAERLRDHSVETIFAEAVGSCTDISATTLQPLKLYHRDHFRVAPYTVVVDPHSCSDPGDAFLFQKQLEEADLVCFTKADLYSEFPLISNQPVQRLSSRTGQGVSGWLHEVMAGNHPSGTKILDIDYQQYAEAEARLAWLNCRVLLQLKIALSPSAVVGPFLDNLDQALSAGQLEIAHLKLTDDTASGFLKAAITRNGQSPTVEGNLAASPSDVHELLLNIRASGNPSSLRHIVEQHISQLPGHSETRHMQCFSPAAPHPEYRFSEVTI